MWRGKFPPSIRAYTDLFKRVLKKKPTGLCDIVISAILYVCLPIMSAYFLRKGMRLLCGLFLISVCCKKVAVTIGNKGNYFFSVCERETLPFSIAVFSCRTLILCRMLCYIMTLQGDFMNFYRFLWNLSDIACSKGSNCNILCIIFVRLNLSLHASYNFLYGEPVSCQISTSENFLKELSFKFGVLEKDCAVHLALLHGIPIRCICTCTFLKVTHLLEILNEPHRREIIFPQSFLSGIIVLCKENALACTIILNFFIFWISLKIWFFKENWKSVMHFWGFVILQ